MSERDDKFSEHMRDVALRLWGDPNPKLTTKDQIRWGKQGSRSVDVQRGVWANHEEGTGGGVLDLVMAVNGVSKAQAAEWLEAEGYITPDLDRRSSGGASRPAQGSNKAAAPRETEPHPKAQIVATYDYVDEKGGLIFQVVRMEVPGRPDIPKTFRQRRPDPSARDGWNWKRGDVRQVPYRLPEVMAAIAKGLIVHVVEGEKDVDALWAAGVPATCNAGGAGKWPAELSDFFNGARVVILPDNDKAGRGHRNLVAAALHRVAREVVWLDLPGLPEKGDVSDWLAMGNDAADLYDLVDSDGQVWTPDAAFESKFRAIPWGRLREPGYEHEWLVKGLITRRERSMVAGPSQSGKSFFCLDLAMAVARGVDFFGHKVSHPGGVIYQAGEGGRGIKRRIEAYMQTRGVEPSDDIPFVLLPAPLDLYGSDDPTNAFIDEVLHWSRTFDVPLELIVIDTFSAASPGANENASEDVSRILARCERIEQATAAHVMLVHHMNAEGNKPRGHTSIFANLEQVITVTNTEEKDDEQIVASFRDGSPQTVRREIRAAKVAKQKDGEAGAIINFVLNAVKVGADEDGDAITSCVIEPPHRSALEGAPVHRESGLDVSPQAAAYLKAIHQAVSEDGITPPDETGFPAVGSGVRVVLHGVVRDRFRRMTFEGQDDDPDKAADAIRKAIQRHGSYLMKHGVIRKNGNYIWLTGKKVKGFTLNNYSEQGSKKQKEKAEEKEQYMPVDADDLPF